MMLKKIKYTLIILFVAVLSFCSWVLWSMYSHETTAINTHSETTLDVTASSEKNDAPYAENESVKFKDSSKETAILGRKKITQRATTPLEPDTQALAATLEGTHIDGQLKADAEGHLIIDLSVRDFFEYFLNTQKEVGINTAMNEILRYAETYLPNKAFLETKELLAQYVKYKQFDLTLRSTPLDPNKPLRTEDYVNLLKDSFEKLDALKQTLFTTEVNTAFFGAEDAYANYTIKNLEVQINPDLSLDEKLTQLELNKSILPIEMLETEATLEYQEYKENQVQELLVSNADEGDIKEQLIKQGFTQEKAEEVLLYEQQQKDFYKRFSDYKSMRDSIASQQLSSDELLAELSEQRNQYFVSKEEITKAYLIDLTELKIE